LVATCAQYANLRTSVFTFFAFPMHQVIEFYEQNLQIARETGDSRGEMSALGSLGRAFAALNERDKAIECFELSLKIAREIGDARNERYMLKHLHEVSTAAEDKTQVQLKSPRKSRKKKDSSTTQSASKSSLRKKAKSQTKKTP
jgi:tetratricopeptide (TPR) repeat protein